MQGVQISLVLDFFSAVLGRRPQLRDDPVPGFLHTVELLPDCRTLLVAYFAPLFVLSARI